jgi:hypothetical protein
VPVVHTDEVDRISLTQHVRAVARDASSRAVLHEPTIPERQPQFESRTHPHLL